MTTRLARDGGTPVRTAPMPRWPAPDEVAVTAAAEVVRSGRLNYWTGSHGRELEREYARTLSRAHAIALANGTVALELALRAFEIGVGDEVVVPARTFIATAGAVVAVGATPVVADIDPLSNDLTAETVVAALSDRTRAVIAVHLGGWPADMDPLLTLARKHDLIVIEDCAQAHGGVYRGRPAGALGSHAATFSFCQDKIVPVGDGGLLALDDDAAFERAWSYKDQGKSRKKLAVLDARRSGASFEWLVDSFGSNLRLDEVSSALAREGLGSLPAWHAARTRNATRLAEGLRDLAGLSIPLPTAEFEHAFYRLYGTIDPDALASGWNRDRVLQAVIAEGIPVQYGTCAEIYREEAFVRTGLAPAERLPGAARAHETSIAFFVHPTLGDPDIDDTIAAVCKVMEVATS